MAEELDTNLPIDETIDQEVVPEEVYADRVTTTTTRNQFSISAFTARPLLSPIPPGGIKKEKSTDQITEEELISGSFLKPKKKKDKTTVKPENILQKKLIQEMKTKNVDPVLILMSNPIIDWNDPLAFEKFKKLSPENIDILKKAGRIYREDPKQIKGLKILMSLEAGIPITPNIPAEQTIYDPRTGQQVPVSQTFGYGSSPDYETQKQNQKFEKEYASGKREYIYNVQKNVWEKKIPNPAAAAGEFIPQGTSMWTTVTETDPSTVFKLNIKNGLFASTSETSDVFPDQDGNQYTLDTENNQWKKLNKNGKFEYVTDQKIIKGLNYTYQKEGNYITKDNKQIIEDKNLVLNSYINDINTVGDKKERESVGYGKRFSSYLELLNNRFNKYGITFGIADKSLVGNIPVVGTITDVAGITDQTIFVNFKRGEKIIDQQQFLAEDPDLYKKIKSLLLANDQHAIDLMMDNKYHMIDAKNKLSEKEKQQKELDELSFEDQRRLNLGETLAGQTTMLKQQEFASEQKEKEEFESQTPEGKKARETYLKDIGIRAVEAERNPDRVAFLAPNTPKLTKDIDRQLNTNAEEIKIFNEKQKSFSQEINEYNSYAGVLETAKKSINSLEDQVNRGEISFEYYQNQRNKIISDIESRYSKFTPEYIKQLEERAKILDQEQKELNVSKSQIQSLNGVIDRAVAINLEWEKDQGTFLGGLTYSALNGIATGVRLISGQSKKEQEETIKLIIGDATKKAYMEDANMLYRSIFGVVESVAAMQAGRTIGTLVGGPVGGLVGGLTSLYSLGYYEMKDQLDQIPGMSDSEKFLMSGIYGVVSSVLEKAGLDAVFKGQASDYAKNLVVKNVVKNIPKGASKEFIDGVIATETKAFMAMAVPTMIESGLMEGGTESLQFLAGEAVKFLDDAYNEAKGKDFFEDKTAWEYVSETAENFALGAIGGAVMSGASQSSKIINREIKLSENKELLEQIDAAARMENFDPLLVSKIKAEIIDGKYTKAQGQEILDNWKQVKTKINSMPDNMPLDQKAVVLDLMTEKDAIGKEISGKDPLLTLPQQARIKEIDEQIKTIGNAVQKPSTEGVLQRQQEGVTETGGERGGVEPIVQGQEVTQEGEATAETKAEEVVPVYHGGDLTQQEGNLYVSEDVNQARAYANENKGDVTKFEIPKSKIADEQTVKETLKENGVEISDEVRLYEAIDPRFEDTYIGDEAKNNLINTLQEKGFDAVQFRDEDITGLEKEGVQNIVVFKPESLQQKSIEVKQSRADELFADGYKPIIDGEVKTEFTQQELNDYFDNNQTIEMTSAPTQVAPESEIDNIPKFQKEPTTEKEFEQQIDGIKEEMNQIPDEIANFDVPSDLTTKNKNNIKSIISRFSDKLKKAWKGGIIKNISDYSGIPMIFTISDQLGAGKVKNEFTGSTIDINGGINFNLTEGNENNAWANTTESEANKMLSRAQELYNNNKDLFDRLWREGKLPKGQVPMAVIKMGQESIQTNEALFRFASDTIKKKFNKTERTNSLNGLIKDIESVDPNSKVINFIKENNFKTIDELLDNVNKLKLGERAIITRFLFTGSIELNKQVKAGKPKSNAGLALIGNKDSSYYKYIHLNTINNSIQDESTKTIPSNHVIGLVGVDVLNPEITKPNHANYPYGVKGGLIGIIESPVHAADVFPEMYSKSFYLNKENKSGKLPSVGQVISQTVASSGAVATTKAFRGSKLSTKITELQKLLGKLKLAFPSVVIVDTQEEFQKALEDENVKKFVKDGDVIYGFTKDGKIFLNPEKANTNTAIHEFSHVWMGFLKKNNPELLKKGYSLLEGTSILKEKIKEFGDNELAREEAMAELIANRGETIIEAGKKSKFKNWLNALFNYVKSKFKSFDELSPEEFQNITLNDFVDGALKSLLKGEEITSDEIKGVGIKFQKENTRQNAIDDAKAKYDLSVTRRRNPHQQGVDAALNDLRKSDWYKSSDDTQRENAERELKKFFGEKLKSAPSVEKVLGKKPQPATFSVSDLGKALRDQLRDAARIAREAKKAIYDSRKSVNESVKEILRQYKGKISLAQARAILNRSNTLNLLNPGKIDQFINYVERVAQRADYAEKVNKAEKTKRQIRRNLKNAQAENKVLAKRFLGIDPSMVDDIDGYNAMADEIMASIAPSRIVKGEPKLKVPAEFTSLNNKIDYMLSEQEKLMKNAMMNSYKDLVDQGVISGDMTYKEMQDIINKIKQDELVEGYNEDDVNNLLDSMFNDKVQEISDMGVTDPNGIISRIQKANIDGMSIKDKAKLVEMLDNFLVNFAVGGLDSVLEVIEGNNQAKSLYESGKKSRPIKYFFSKIAGNLRSIALVTAPEMFNLVFNGVVAGTKVMDRAGFGKVILGANKARNTKNALENEYAEKFGKQKNFWNIDNTIERGMVAFLARYDKQENIQSELNRRVDMINSAIETLKKGTKEEQKLAKTYQKVADRLNINSFDIETIYNNSKLMNREAVVWMIDKWANIYGDLSFVSLSVYNTMLSRDLNYTTDRYRKTEMSSSITGAEEIPTTRSSYMMNSDTLINKTETGVLMPNTKPSVSTIEGQGRYIDLSFEMNNFSAMEGALVDIETAAAVRRVDAFMNSNYLSKVITDPGDLEIIKGKVSKYIASIKNRSVISNKQYQKVLRDIQKKIGLNFLGKIGYSLGLGSVFQPIMQTIPVITNTALQAGPTSFIDLFRTGSAFQQWINKSGAAVSNRGQEAVTAIESADSKIKTFENYTDKISDGISKFFNLKLKYLLSKPDIWVARGAFLSYYKQYLEMNNVDSSKINWDTWNQEIKDNGLENINKEAILYADNMVNRNQNVSDERLAGELLSSQDEVMKIIRKTLFPYASFSINSRAKIATDIATIYNWKQVSSEDRTIARKSLAGTLSEQAVFHGLNMTRLFLLGTIASLIYGDDDDENEEERKKRMKDASKFPIKSLIGDLVSPAPIVDEILVNVFDMFSDDTPFIKDLVSPTEKEVNDAVNKENERRALNYTGNVALKFKMNPEEERKFREKYLRDNSYKLGNDYPGAKESGRYGLFSVGYDQWKRFVDRYDMATTGEYLETDQFGNTTKKYLGDQDKNLVKLTYFMGDLPAIIGGSFKEGSQISNNIYKKIEKNSYTYEQYGVYKEFKKRYNREPQAWESMLIRENINFLPTEQSKKSITEVVDYIKDLGGFTNKEGKEFVKALGKITESYDWNQYYKMIKSGKKYEDLLNYSLKIRKEAIKKQEEEDKKLKQLEMEQQKAIKNFVPPPL